MPQDLTLVEAIGGLSATGLLILAIVAFVKGWVVTAREHAHCQAEVEFWRSRALKALALTESAVNGEG